MQGDHARRSCKAIARRSCEAIMRGDHRGDHARRTCEAIMRGQSSGGPANARYAKRCSKKDPGPGGGRKRGVWLCCAMGVCNLYEQSGTQKLIQNRPQQTAAARGRLAVQARTARTTSAMHIGKTKIAALVFVGQPLVVDAEQMQQGRLQVMNVEPDCGRCCNRADRSRRNSNLP